MLSADLAPVTIIRSRVYAAEDARRHLVSIGCYRAFCSRRTECSLSHAFTPRAPRNELTIWGHPRKSLVCYRAPLTESEEIKALIQRIYIQLIQPCAFFGRSGEKKLISLPAPCVFFNLFRTHLLSGLVFTSLLLCAVRGVER